jgi:hypothetical protein
MSNHFQSFHFPNLIALGASESDNGGFLGRPAYAHFGLAAESDHHFVFLHALYDSEYFK